MIRPPAKTRHQTVLFICVGLLVSHAMRTNVSLTAARLLNGSDKVGRLVGC